MNGYEDTDRNISSNLKTIVELEGVTALEKEQCRLSCPFVIWSLSSWLAVLLNIVKTSYSESDQDDPFINTLVVYIVSIVYKSTL